MSKDRLPEYPRAPKDHQQHHNTLDAQGLALLAEYPRFSDELPGQLMNTHGPLRNSIRKFNRDVSPTGTGHTRMRQTQIVYHLSGDRRRAIRRWIARYHEDIREVIEEHGTKPVTSMIPDDDREIFWFEWELGRRHGFGVIDG